MTESYSAPKLVVGLVSSLVIYSLLTWLQFEHIIIWCLSITCLTAFYWISGAIPIPAASLIPFVLFPITGVLTFKQASSSLGDHIIILLMGGFMIARGLEKANLHKRFALIILNAVGGKGGKRLVIAFMLCGALLSMWISNTASCLVLMPIAMAVLKQAEDESLYVPTLLGIAFSCNIGGIGTLVGTPTNLLFAGVYQTLSGEEFAFLQWMKIGVLVVVIGLPLMAFWLCRNIQSAKSIALPQVGSWSSAEKRVLAVFGFVVFLWVFRLEPFGGWSNLSGISTVGDSTIALLGVLFMFIIPSNNQDKPKEALLDWETASNIPWGMLILFAGGITVAKAFQYSGTAELMGNALSSAVTLHPLLLTFIIAIGVVFLTDITSNVATTSLLMPVLGATAMANNLPIEMLMIPAAMAASCAFMLPVATAPNAIVFGTGKVSVRQMAQEGIVLNVVMGMVISVICYLLL